MADEQSARTRSSSTKSDLKKHIHDLISNDKNLLDTIADIVSSMIVEKIADDKDFLGKVSTKLSESMTLKNSVTEALRENIKQDVYESLAFDTNALKTKIQDLQATISDLKNTQNVQLQELNNRYDSLEQYGRRNCLLVHGIAESLGESTDDLVLNVFNNKLKVAVKKSDLDRTHRLGRYSANRTRPIIVKFSTYNIRSQIFKVKKYLKGQGISISESLTIRRKELYAKVRTLSSIKNAWTLDGRIICLTLDDSKIVVENYQDLEKLPT